METSNRNKRMRTYVKLRKYLPNYICSKRSPPHYRLPGAGISKAIRRIGRGEARKHTHAQSAIGPRSRRQPELVVRYGGDRSVAGGWPELGKEADRRCSCSPRLGPPPDGHQPFIGLGPHLGCWTKSAFMAGSRLGCDEPATMRMRPAPCLISFPGQSQPGMTPTSKKNFILHVSQYFFLTYHIYGMTCKFRFYDFFYILNQQKL